jgi:hypothetical protein
MRKWLSYLMAVAVAGAFLGCVTFSERGNTNTKIQVKENPSGTHVKVHSNQKVK